MTNEDKTDSDTPIGSGPDEGTWWWHRFQPAPARDPYSFEGETGTFNKDGSVSSDAKVYPVDGTFDDDYHCSLMYSLNKDYWEAMCMGSSAYTWFEVGDGGCDVNEIATSMLTYPQAKGVPQLITTGICVRADDDALGDGLERVAEEGDLNGLDNVDDACADDFTLVHQIGINDAEATLTQLVAEDNCAQFCAPNFVLDMLAEENIVSGGCGPEGFDSLVSQTSFVMGPTTVIADVFEKGDN